MGKFCRCPIPFLAAKIILLCTLTIIMLININKEEM